MSNLTCPNCGDAVPDQMKLVKMMTCASCGTTLSVLPSDLTKLGESGDLHDAPRLFGLGDTVQLGKRRIDIQGHAQFSYGRGFWDEFWGTDQDGASLWVSVDEGDIAVQTPLHKSHSPRVAARPRLGQTIAFQNSAYTITELETATCSAFRGSFDETLELGETYTFVNLKGEDGAIMSGELWPGGQMWFIGHWIDPFDVKLVTLT